NEIASGGVAAARQPVVSQPLISSAAKTAVAPRFFAVRNTARCFLSASASSRPPLYYFSARALIRRGLLLRRCAYASQLLNGSGFVNPKPEVPASHYI